MLSGQQFNHFPDELQQHSRAFDAALTSALENAALVCCKASNRRLATEVADNHAQLKQSYTEHHGIDSLPDDLAMEWKLRFMLDQQIMELVEQIQKRALDSVSYRLKAVSTID